LRAAIRELQRGRDSRVWHDVKTFENVADLRIVRARRAEPRPH
jgi:hypothetical protein